ncbi:MAG: multidrug effflux MFS transporter [Steroidobacteraceae bacterium]
MTQPVDPVTTLHTVSISTFRLMLILGTMTAFGPFAIDMYLASFPGIARDLDTTLARVQLTLSMFFIGLAAGQLIYGPLIDRYGRRRPLLIGVGVFTLASLVCVFAPNVESLIALRLVQALGGCAGMVIGRAIISDLYSEGEVARVLSSMMAVQSFGPIVSPMLGGLLLLVAGWRVMFVVLTLLGLLCFTLTARWLPETLPPEKRTSQPLNQILITFVRLLWRREFILPTLAGSAALACVSVFITGSPYVFMGLHGVNEQQFALLFGLVALGIVMGAQLNRVMLQHWSPRRVLPWALAANMLVSLMLLAVAHHAALWVFIIPLLLCIATVPLIGANSAAIAMAASGGELGSASSIYGLIQFGLASVASSLVSTLHDGTAYPMALVILGASVLGNMIYLLRKSAA